MSADLVAFLKERLDEDERAAQAASPGPWSVRVAEDGRADVYAPASARLKSLGFGRAAVAVETDGVGAVSAADADHIARWDPARVLAEVAAKRAILDRMVEVMGDSINWDFRSRDLAEDTVRAVAQPFAGRAGFDPSWLD